MNTILSIFLLVLSTTPWASAVDPVLEAALEKDILVALYQYTSGETWTRQNHWLSDPIHHCDWEGITCLSPEVNSRALQAEDTRSVEVINLAENNLKGSVPLSLLMLLPNIRIIKLNGNNVDFTKYAQQEEEVLGQAVDFDRALASNIRHLDVSHTTVSSLESIFRAGHGNTVIATPHLTDLYASQSQIRGAVPSFVFETTTLERLSLDHNSLTGSIPATLGNLDKLKYLSLKGNDFHGKIPEEVNRLYKIRYVLLGSNRLTGSIPMGLTSTEYTPLLEQLDISDQRPSDSTPSSQAGLSGSLPAFNTHKFLRRLDLSFNSFTGAIPQSFLETTEIESFDFASLSANDLTGSVPSTVMARLPEDGFLVNDNRITDVAQSQCTYMEFGCKSFMCPPGFFEPRSGRQESEYRPCLTCTQNTLYWGQTKCKISEVGPPPPPPSPTISPTTAPIPGVVQKTEGDILLEFFQATGGDNWDQKDGWEDGNTAEVCSWFGVECKDRNGAQSVVGFSLDSNNLVGTTPESLFDLPNLGFITVSRNEGLTFDFKKIGRAKHLLELDLSSTKLSSNGLNDIGGLASTLQELYLSDVEGLGRDSIPTVLLTLRELRQLTLDYNGIGGSLPDDLGHLSNMVVFSVVNNALTGNVPESIYKMSNLATFRVSTNHMGGSLPSGLFNLKGLTVLDLSNQWSNGEDDDFDSSGHSGFVGTLPSFAGFKELRRLDLAVNSFHGPIPDNFLSDIDRSDGGLFEYADLSENYLSGTVPAEVAGIPKLYLQDNRFMGIDPLVCSSQPSNLASFGCDAVLCMPGFYHENGRQVSKEAACEPCPDGEGIAQFYGATDCDFEDDPFGAAVPTEAPVPHISEDAAAREALERIYNFCGGSSWTLTTGWMNDDISYCDWEGIRCSIDGKVIDISLRSNNLAGMFPTSKVLKGLPNLQSLDLDGNKIMFPFDGIESAENLEILDLSHTDLEFVQGISAAKSLKNLYLSSNNLRGPFPDEILQLTNLSRLAIDFNSLTGAIPPTMSALTNLQFLAMHDNKFSGNLPVELAEHTGLYFLLMQSNDFTGPIPDEYGSLFNLRYLDLSGQSSSNGGGLTGNLPNFVGLTQLKRLDLSDNNLEGPIPADFLSQTPAQGFEYLDLSENKLTGDVPSVLSKFPADLLDLADNKISGIDQAVCAAASYGCDTVLCPAGKYNTNGKQIGDGDKCVDCPENTFYGTTSCGENNFTQAPTATPDPNFDHDTILKAFYDALNGDGWTKKDNWKDTNTNACDWHGIACDGEGNVKSIELSGNNLHGKVPTEIFQLPMLETLILDLNDDMQFDFHDIGNAKRLEVIDVSSTNTNDLKGVGSAKGLKEFHAVANALRGSIETELFTIDSLERLNLGFNELSGDMSADIGKLTNLKLLSCESNYFSGALPESLGRLTNIRTLRLDRNTFIGTLPPTMAMMTDLNLLDLSHQTENNGRGLSGPIPAFESLKNVRVMDLSANAFTGSIPATLLSNANAEIFEYADLSSNKLSGVIPASLARFDEVLLHDNEFTGISEDLCAAERGPVYEKYRCRAVLCPPGTYNNKGRQESDTSTCQDCSAAVFYGSTVCPSSMVDVTDSSDREILTYFYRKCGGDEWDDSTNWLSDAHSICDWHGITCVPGTETAQTIELGANNVVGVPPKALYYLPELKVLSLYSNPLDGFTFESIQKAEKLVQLILDATGISTIQGVGNAASLKSLNLRFNGLRGGFPGEISKLTNLEDLMLSYNDFTGTLPRFLEDMTGLRTLLLTSNQFSGHLKGVNIPESMKFLDLSENALTGSIPGSFLTLVPFDTAMEVDLSDNLLTGSIPSDLVRFDRMNLYVSNNMINDIPPELCDKQYWNDGDVGKYGCNGLLCPAGHYNLNGRQRTDDAPCQKCNNLPYLGMDNCEGHNSSASSRAMLIFVSSALAIVAAVTLSW